MGVWSSMFYGGLEKATGRSIGGNLKGGGNENLWKELYGGKAHAKICGGARKHNYAWSSSDKQYEEKQTTTNKTINIAAYITFTHPNTSSESSQTVMDTMPMDSGTQNLQKLAYANNKHNTNKCHKRKLIASQRKHQNATTTHM